MSAQFGKCNFDGKPVDPQELERVRPVLAPYGPDDERIFRKDNIGIIYRAFHTTKESRLENQPHVSPSGAVITWDGRLDNRSELVHEFDSELSNDSTDLSIVTAAYERWGTDSFAKWMGDWAVSIWSPRSQSLVLAKDFVGTRNLYYWFDEDQVTWSTVLDPLVLSAGKTCSLSEEYIAGWLSFFPATHLTPYVGIHSVPPSSFVLLQPRKHTVKKYWDFDPRNSIRYRADGEYEEHFRTVFAEAVRRRLRSDNPILAELSGGMDSSSIVCMADTIIAQGAAETPRLDTLSYYNDSEPNWNERPYFTKVEERRGRTGCHIDVSSQNPFDFELSRYAFTPSAYGHPKEISQRFTAYLTSQGDRVVLSGIGGDEVTGGVPTPLPELMDLLANFRIRPLVSRLAEWALSKRKPWLHLLSETVRAFLPPTLASVPTYKRPAPWLHSGFVRRNRVALAGYESRLKLFGDLPSHQENMSTLDALRRQLGCENVSPLPIYEKRYPFLDRDLLAFMFAVPREQLVRPGQRRSLMRRALVGIVPDELLNRKRKAFVTRSPLMAVSTESANLMKLSRHMVSRSLGIVDTKAFCNALKIASTGQEIAIVTLMRTLCVEFWLRDCIKAGVLQEHEFNFAQDGAADCELNPLIGQSS